MEWYFELLICIPTCCAVCCLVDHLRDKRRRRVRINAFKETLEMIDKIEQGDNKFNKRLP